MKETDSKYDTSKLNHLQDTCQTLVTTMQRYARKRKKTMLKMSSVNEEKCSVRKNTGTYLGPQNQVKLREFQLNYENNSTNLTP